MRASKNSSSDDIRERYLGEIAPLLDAAGPIDSLSELQKKQVRRRIVRTLFRTRLLNLRVRLVPVLVALGMLVIGGGAFATAERLGLISKMGTKKANAPAIQPKQEVRKRRSGGARPANHGRGAGSPEATAVEADLAFTETASVVLPEVPDPLLFPLAEANTAGWSLLARTRETAAAAKTRVAPIERVAMASAEMPAKPLRRPAKLVATAARAPVMAVPAPVTAAPAQAYVGQVVPREKPAAEQLAFAQVQPSPASVAAVASPTLTAAAVAPLAPMPQPVAPAPLTPAVAVAKSVTAASVPRAPLDDQALFGQAMRKLRMENDPSAALSALQEHAKAYPRSSLGGERVALEVEALLALHRDRDALARLDTMALDDLPRSGERFVVRGELRAAARRWQEASADFDRALSRVSGSPAWHERALWGRGAARLRCGEREAGLADFEHYLDKYPDGRFASAAARFFPNR
jgi:TolA-binding protein